MFSPSHLFLMAKYFVFKKKYRQVFVLIYARTQFKFWFLIFGQCDHWDILGTIGSKNVFVNFLEFKEFRAHIYLRAIFGWKNNNSTSVTLYQWLIEKFKSECYERAFKCKSASAEKPASLTFSILVDLNVKKITAYFVWLNIVLFSRKSIIAKFGQNATFEAQNLRLNSRFRGTKN